MSDNVPRRLPPTDQERQQIAATGVAGGGLRWSTRWGRRISPSPEAQRVNGVAVVKHRTDPDLPRPLATTVLWAGSADPVNAAPWDFRYPADDFDDD